MLIEILTRTQSTMVDLPLLDADVSLWSPRNSQFVKGTKLLKVLDYLVPIVNALLLHHFTHCYKISYSK